MKGGKIKMMNSKKGMSLGNAPTAILAFGLLVIISSVVALVLSNINTTFTAGTYESNITNKGLSGVYNFATFNPTVGTVMAAALIVGIVVTSLGAYMVSRR